MIVGIILVLICCGSQVSKAINEHHVANGHHAEYDAQFIRPPQIKGHNLNEIAHLFEESTAADQLFKTVRVLCWVMTDPLSYYKAEAIKNTWGPRCNVLLFMSTQINHELPTIAQSFRVGPESLWPRTKAAFKYIHEHHRNNADWFLKADDDTYLIPENLRLLLSNYSSSDPLYLGCRLKYGRESYMYGGAGYVLSRRALDLFVNEFGAHKRNCLPDFGEADDIEMGMCLQKTEVRAVDTRDEYGRWRFLPDNIQTHLFPRTALPWYKEQSYYPLAAQGFDHVSDYAISFHLAKPEHMSVLYYFLYHVRAFGNIKESYSSDYEVSNITAYNLTKRKGT